MIKHDDHKAQREKVEAYGRATGHQVTYNHGGMRQASSMEKAGTIEQNYQGDHVANAKDRHKDRYDLQIEHPKADVDMPSIRDAYDSDRKMHTA